MRSAAAEKTEEGDSGKDDSQEHTGKEAEDPQQHDAALARVTQRAAEAEDVYKRQGYDRPCFVTPRRFVIKNSR